MARSSFAKLQRDRDKRAKAAAKRERRQNRDEKGEDEEGAETDEATEPMSEESTEELLGQIAKLHEQFEDGQIPFQTFEEQKAELMARLSVD